MARTGHVWAAASKDYDTLLFGAPRLLRFLTISGKEFLPSQGTFRPLVPELLDLRARARSLGHHAARRSIDLALLVGTDFNDGVHGIGPKKALALVQQPRPHRSDAAPRSATRSATSRRCGRSICSPSVTDDYTIEFARARSRRRDPLSLRRASVLARPRHRRAGPRVSAAGIVLIYASSSRTRGMTFVPNSSMLVISLSCGSVPLLYFMSKRDRPSALTVVRDLSRDRLRRADVERAVRAGLALEVIAADRRPAALAADARHHRHVVRPHVFLRLLVGRGDVAGRVHRDRLQRLAELLERLAIELDVRDGSAGRCRR